MYTTEDPRFFKMRFPLLDNRQTLNSMNSKLQRLPNCKPPKTYLPPACIVCCILIREGICVSEPTDIKCTSTSQSNYEFMTSSSHCMGENERPERNVRFPFWENINGGLQSVFFCLDVTTNNTLLCL